MWRDEIKRAAVCHRSTRRKVSREMIMFAICICPHLPHSAFWPCSAPRRPLIEYWQAMWLLWVNHRTWSGRKSLFITLEASVLFLDTLMNRGGWRLKRGIGNKWLVSVSYHSSEAKRVICDQNSYHWMGHLLIRLCNLALWIFYSRPPTHHRLACTRTVVDCWLFAEFRIRTGNAALHRWHRADVLASFWKQITQPSYCNLCTASSSSDNDVARCRTSGSVAMPWLAGTTRTRLKAIVKFASWFHEQHNQRVLHSSY